MKNRILRLIVSPTFLFFFIAFFCTNGYGQTANSIPINITWNKETACQTFEETGERNDILELIADGTCIRVCEGSEVTYTVTGNTSEWGSTVWNVAGGTILNSDSTACTVQWGNTGAGMVSVSIPSQGQIHVREMCIEIINSPKASFGVFPNLETTDIYACANETIYFANSSDSNGGSEIVSYYWEFSDGYFSSEFEPTHIFDSPGVYHVKLTVRNNCNCTSSYTATVKVIAKGFDIICPSVVCDGQRANYSLPADVAGLCSQFIWKVEGGEIVANNNSSIQVDWNNVDDSGFGYVTFDPAHCQVECPIRTTIKIPVIKNQGTIKGEGTICQGSENLYSLPQWPDTEFIWSIEDNDTGSFLVPTDQSNIINLNALGTGTIILRAIYTNKLLNCGGVAELHINIKGTTIIQGPRIICKNAEEPPQEEGVYQYTNSSSATVSWLLTGPSGFSQTHMGTGFTPTFAVVGEYIMSISSPTLCPADKMFIQVQEISSPSISGPSSICIRVPLIFGILTENNASPEIPGTILEWQVYSGTIIGSNIGPEVTVIFDDNAVEYEGFVSVVRKSLTAPYCESIVDKFELSSDNPANISGISTVCPSTEAEYEVTSENGESFVWSVLPSTLGSVVAVSQESQTSTATIMWNENPSNTAAFVQVAIRKCGILADPISFPVSIKTPPTSTISAPDTVCRDANVLFNVDMTQLTSATSIDWNFGDGAIITGAFPTTSVSHSFTTIATDNIQYTVTATVNGANGCNSIVLQKIITVMPAPVAYISPQQHKTFCNDQVIDFTLTATAEDGYGLTTASDVIWYKNDLNTQVGLGFTYQVQSVGTYFAVVSNGTCTKTTNVVIVLHKNCTGVDGNTGPCTPQQVTLEGSSNCKRITVNASNIGTYTSFNWNGGPNATQIVSTASQFEATYPTAGMYNISYSAIINECALQKNISVLIPYVAGAKYIAVCGTLPNTYKVTLLDDSDYFPSITIANRIYKINGTVVHTGPEQEFEVTLLAGVDYTFSLEIQSPNPEGGSFSPCTATKIIELPEIPNVEIIIQTPVNVNDDNIGDYCSNRSIQFDVLNGNPDFTYVWNFGDESYNTLQNPKKTFNEGAPRTIKLTVTNKLGCTQIVDLNLFILERLDGEIIKPDQTSCLGSTVMLDYNSLSENLPLVYDWMQGTTSLDTTAVPNYPVTQSGSYWVVVSDEHGCSAEINAAHVAFYTPPTIVINGPTAVCEGTSFMLTANVNANVGYTWTDALNNEVVSSTNNFEVEYLLPGTYTYNVTALSNQPGECSTTVSHTVTVMGVPDPFDISMSLLNCEKYLIRLTANGSGAGTYTWSDGQMGQTIQVNEGGAYRVRFTNEGGCSTTSDILVPRNPEGYLWTFPSGCYALCEQTTTATLIGPNIPFDSWLWLFNGSVVSEGSGIVAPYSVVNSGTYNLLLNNGLCKKISKPMDVTLQSCDCKFRVRVEKISRDTQPFCHYTIAFLINNPFGYPISVSLSVPNGEGIFVPSTITIPVGGAQFEVTFIPFSNFSAGDVVVAFQTVLVNGKTCRFETKFRFEESCFAGGKSTQQPLEAALADTLLIVPNPVLTTAELHYNFAAAAQEVRTLSIYTVTGVLLKSYTIRDQTGNWIVNLDKYPSGQYVVVMREGATIKSQKNLIKI